MDVRVLLRQKLSLRLGPHHERVHRPPDASLRPSGTPSLASGHTTGRQRRAATQHGLGGGGPPLSPPGLGGGRLWREVQRLVGRGAVAVAVVMVMRRVRRGVSVVRVRGWRREGEAGQHVRQPLGFETLRWRVRMLLMLVMLMLLVRMVLLLLLVLVLMMIVVVVLHVLMLSLGRMRGGEVAVVERHGARHGPQIHGGGGGGQRGHGGKLRPRVEQGGGASGRGGEGGSVVHHLLPSGPRRQSPVGTDTRTQSTKTFLLGCRTSGITAWY